MSEKYFDRKENKEKLNRIVAGWIGTSYHHMGASRGGVDCTKFVALVLVEMAILSDFEKNIYYPSDWYMHGNEEICLNSIERNLTKYLLREFYVEQYPFDFSKIEFGDLLCIAKNRKGFVNHTALYLGDNKIAHCVSGAGVFIGQFSFAYSQRTKKIFRLFYRD